MISEIYQKKFSESGFQVFAVDSGDQVLSLIAREKVDAVLLDLIIPKMSGFEVLENIKKSGKYDSNIKVIIFSNLSQKEDRDKARELGADGFISKADYTPSALVKEVQRLLNTFFEEEKNERNGIMDSLGRKILNGNGNVADKNGKKILMIEDEEIFEEMFGGKLRQDGYDVTFAKNGVWGLKEALKDDYNLFVIDMILPGMTGDEIISRLKMEEKTKNIPIVVLSASVDEKMERKVREMGADEFFVKTQLIPSELSKKVSEILKVN